jgi:hypothetical protein
MHRGERDLIMGFENCVVDNIGRRVRMPLFGLSRPARRAKVICHRLVGDYIEAEELHKFL